MSRLDKWFINVFFGKGYKTSMMERVGARVLALAWVSNMIILGLFIHILVK